MSIHHNLLLVAATLFGAASALIVSHTCANQPPITAAPNFNLDAFVAPHPWYIHLIYPLSQEANASCEIAQLSLKTDNATGQQQLNLTQQLLLGGQKAAMTNVGVATPGKPPGWFTTIIDAYQASQTGTPFVVLYQDVVDGGKRRIFILWACFTPKQPNAPANSSDQGIWVGTDDGVLTDSDLETTKQVLTRNGISLNGLVALNSNPTTCSALL